jgi:hypothetical protein
VRHRGRREGLIAGLAVNPGPIDVSVESVRVASCRFAPHGSRTDGSRAPAHGSGLRLTLSEAATRPSRRVSREPDQFRGAIRMSGPLRNSP